MLRLFKAVIREKGVRGRATVWVPARCYGDAEMHIINEYGGKVLICTLMQITDQRLLLPEYDRLKQGEVRT